MNHPNDPTPCASQAPLFDSTVTHKQAKKLCEGCWRLTTCAVEPVPRNFEGTWAGKLYGARNLPPRKRQVCGTLAGYRKHKRVKERACDACKVAYRESEITRARKQPAQCGTDAGYLRHKRASEPTCGPCMTAHAIAGREYRERRKSA